MHPVTLLCFAVCCACALPACGSDHEHASDTPDTSDATDTVDTSDATAPASDVPDSASEDSDAGDEPDTLGDADTAAPDAVDDGDDAVADLVAICHRRADGAPEVLEVTLAEADEHFAHGDPRGVLAPVLAVDAAAGANGLGTSEAPLSRIGEALALARCGYQADGVRRTIDVAPGTYRASYDAALLAADASVDPAPFVLDFPVHLHGATVVVKDQDGVPLGDYAPYLDATRATVLAPEPAFASGDEAMVFVADTSDVQLDGLVFRSGHCRVEAHCPGEAVVSTRGGTAVMTTRADRVVLADDVFFPGFNAAVDTKGGAVSLSGSFASDTGICTACFADGGTYDVTHNRLENGLGGVLIAGSFGPASVSLGTQADDFTIADFAGVAEPSVTAVISDNVLIGHTRNTTAFGVRIIAFGPGAAGNATKVSLSARVLGNTIALPDGGAGAHNGILIDAGFAVRIPGPLDASIAVEVGGNTISALRKPVVVIGTRAQVITNDNPAGWQDSTVIDEGDIAVDTDLAYPADFWVDHFAADPVAGLTTSGGPCADNFACSSATYRGAPVPGVCTDGTCACPTELVADDAGVCQDPSPTHTQMTINGEVVPPGTAIP